MYHLPSYSKKKVFFKDVAPVIRRKCTKCHNPSGLGPMDFISYEDILGRSAMFKYVIEKDLMPPWYLDPNTGPYKDDLSLSLEEKALLLKWAQSGFPKKGKKTALLWANKKYEKVKAKADYILTLPEKVKVPAEGSALYKRFLIQTPFKKDRWIKDVKFILKPKVVHHMMIHVMKPSFSRDKEGVFGHYNKAVNLLYLTHLKADSTSDINYNQDLYKKAGAKIPRHSQLIWEIHYESIGQEIIDDYTRVQINFYRKKPKYEIITHLSQNTGVNIPPYESNYKISSSYKIKQTMPLVLLGSHMHLRGKASSIVIVGPDGVRKRIFGIDPFTQTFQSLYRLKEPYMILKGSTIECINWFDNSANNPINPSPEKQVTFGVGFEDEMSSCFFQWLAPVNQNSQHIFWQFDS